MVRRTAVPVTPAAMTQAPSEAAEDVTARPPVWRRWLADTTPLRESADYRRWWAGYSISFTGTQLTQFAIPVQVYFLTHSSLAVGLVGLDRHRPAHHDGPDRRRRSPTLSTGAG